MEEIPAILHLWNQVEREGCEAVLATVVRVRGSSYRQPGARLLFTFDGRRAGSVSGGCLEGDLIRKGAWWTGQGPRIVTYGTGADEDGRSEFGLGCNGTIDILVERVGRGKCEAVKALLERTRVQRAVGLIATAVEASVNAPVAAPERMLLTEDEEFDQTSVPRDILEQARNALVSGRSCMDRFYWRGEWADIFFEVLTAPVRLLVFGGGWDAVPLVTFATELGWDVIVVTHKQTPETAVRFSTIGARVMHCTGVCIDEVPVDAGSLAVLMTHSFDRDSILLPQLLRRDLLYLGILGPRDRTRRLLAAIPASPERYPALHFPAGLDIGSHSPAATALSIISEMQAVVSGRTGGMLRHRPEPIHSDMPKVCTQAAGVL